MIWLCWWFCSLGREWPFIQPTLQTSVLPLPMDCYRAWPQWRRKREIAVPMSLPEGWQLTWLCSYLPGTATAALAWSLLPFPLSLPFLPSANLSQVLSALSSLSSSLSQEYIYIFIMNQYNNLSQEDLQPWTLTFIGNKETCSLGPSNTDALNFCS